MSPSRPELREDDEGQSNGSLTDGENLPPKNFAFVSERRRPALAENPQASPAEPRERQHYVWLRRQVVLVDVREGSHVLADAHRTEDEAGLGLPQNSGEQLNRDGESLAITPEPGHSSVHENTCSEGPLCTTPTGRPSRNLFRQPPKNL